MTLQFVYFCSSECNCFFEILQFRFIYLKNNFCNNIIAFITFHAYMYGPGNMHPMMTIYGLARQLREILSLCDS